MEVLEVLRPNKSLARLFSVGRIFVCIIVYAGLGPQGGKRLSDRAWYLIT